MRAGAAASRAGEDACRPIRNRSRLAARDWVPFYPKDGIFDEAREEFEFDAGVFAASGAAILAIRVFDDANNVVIQNVALR